MKLFTVKAFALVLDSSSSGSTGDCAAPFRPLPCALPYHYPGLPLPPPLPLPLPLPPFVAHFDLYFFPCFGLVLVIMLVKVKERHYAVEETAIVTVSEIVMVNENVGENKMVTMTENVRENVRENVMVTKIVTVNSTLMVLVMEKGSYVLNSLCLSECQCENQYPSLGTDHHYIPKSSSLPSNQAHTCKTLGVVTKPSRLLARMRRCIRVILSTSARGQLAQLISYSRPRPAPLGAGRGREYENMSSRACHVKHHAS